MVKRSEDDVLDRLVEYTLTYNKTFGKHSLAAVIGYTYQHLSSEGFGLSSSDFPDIFSYNNLGAANLQLKSNNISSYKSESFLDGILGRVNYSYNDKYLLTLNFRRDGSSRFGSNNRYGYFPSISAGWKISEESFMKNISIISNLKLRAGYGVTGNQNGIGDYTSREIYGPNGKYYDPINQVYKTAYGITQNANPNLKWETSAMTNVGLDFGFLNNRLTGAIEVYNKDTKNLIFNYAVSPGDHYANDLTYITNSIVANVGSMNNKGVEFSLDYLAIDKEDFTWRTNFNISRNVNKVVKLSGDGLTFPKDGIRYGVINGGVNGYGPYSVIKEGLPVGTFYGPKEIGLNDKGQPLYEVRDTLGNLQPPTIDPGAATKENLGNAQPKFNFGWTNSFTYKNFDLSIFLRGSVGQKVFNAANLVLDNPTTFRIIDENPTNVYKTAFGGNNAGLTTSGAVSGRYVQDASFLRIDNVNLGYKVPIKSPWVRSIRLYIAAQNLLLVTKYKGLDPEVRSGSVVGNYGQVNSTDNVAFGLDDFSFYPRARTFTIGLSAGF